MKIKQKTSAPYHPKENQHAEGSVKFIKAALKGWKDVKNKSKEDREIWIIEKMAGKNNKEQSATKRSTNELILGRNEKEDNIVDSEC